VAKDARALGVAATLYIITLSTVTRFLLYFFSFLSFFNHSVLPHHLSHLVSVIIAIYIYI